MCRLGCIQPEVHAERNRYRETGLADPVPHSMKLKPTSYLMLGMLRLGATSGYAIKKAVDISTRVFFATSLAQVYPELAHLESHGLVTRREDPHGARVRSAYEVTDQGEEALLAWLRSDRFVPTQFRDEGLLRLFFADALPGDDQVVLVRQMRERARGAETWMREEILPAATRTADREGFRHPLTVARLGADTYGFLADWLERLEADLETSRA